MDDDEYRIYQQLSAAKARCKPTNPYCEGVPYELERIKSRDEVVGDLLEMYYRAKEMYPDVQLHLNRIDTSIGYRFDNIEFVPNNATTRYRNKNGEPAEIIRKQDLTEKQLQVYYCIGAFKKKCEKKNIAWVLDRETDRAYVAQLLEKQHEEAQKMYPNNSIILSIVDKDKPCTMDNIRFVPSKLLNNLPPEIKEPLQTQLKKERPPNRPKRKYSVPVKCLTSGQVYKNAGQAEKVLEIQRGAIRACCIGDAQSAGKYHGLPRVWQNATDEEYLDYVRSNNEANMPTAANEDETLSKASKEIMKEVPLRLFTYPAKDNDTIRRRIAIIDIDSTIADCQHRVSYAKAKQWDKFYALAHYDTPLKQNIKYIKKYCKKNKLTPVFVTGRSEIIRKDTEAFIEKYYKPKSVSDILMPEFQVSVYELHMRPKNTTFPAEEIKRTHLKHLMEDYAISVVFEDNEKCLAMYEEELRGFPAEVMDIKNDIGKLIGKL